MCYRVLGFLRTIDLTKTAWPFTFVHARYSLCFSSSLTILNSFCVDSTSHPTLRVYQLHGRHCPYSSSLYLIAYSSLRSFRHRTRFSIRLLHGITSISSHPVLYSTSFIFHFFHFPLILLLYCMYHCTLHGSVLGFPACFDFVVRYVLIFRISTHGFFVHCCNFFFGM